MSITPEILQQAFQKGKSQHGGKKEDYFAPLYLSEKSGRPLEEVFRFCSFKKNTSGIDAYYIDREAGNLYLYLFRWTEQPEAFKDAYQHLIHKGMEQIFHESSFDPSPDPLPSRLKMDLQEFQ